MGNVPVLKPQDVIKILNAVGFEEVRQRGSHKQFLHPDGRATTVPFHRQRHRADAASEDRSRHWIDDRGVLGAAMNIYQTRHMSLTDTGRELVRESIVTLVVVCHGFKTQSYSSAPEAGNPPLHCLSSS